MWSPIQLFTLFSLLSAATALDIPATVNCKEKGKIFSRTEIQAAMTRGQTANPAIRGSNNKDYPAHHGGYDTNVGAGKEFPIMSNGRDFASMYQPLITYLRKFMLTTQKPTGGDNPGHFRVVYAEGSNDYLGVVEHTGLLGGFKACDGAASNAPTTTGLVDAPKPTKNPWGCKRSPKKNKDCKRDEYDDDDDDDDETFEERAPMTVRWEA